VEIVRRAARELFQHELVIGNFSGKYFVTMREGALFAWKYRPTAYKNPHARVEPGHEGSNPFAGAAADILPNS
jgi:hypothetical protein